MARSGMGSVGAARNSGSMDITQILLGIGAVTGILIVCILAVVPTVMDFTLPEGGHSRSRRRHRPATTVHHLRHHRSDRQPPTDGASPIDLAA